MKRIIASVLCLIIAGLMVLTLTSCSGDQEPRTTVDIDQGNASGSAVRVALADDYSPYLIADGGKASGIDAEAAQAVAQAMGAVFSYVTADRADIAEGLKSGEYDLALCGFRADDAELIDALTSDGLTLSDSCYGYVQTVIVDSNSKITELSRDAVADMDCVIGVKKGSVAEALLLSDLPDAADRVRSFSTGIDAVSAITAQSVDCVVTDINPAYDYRGYFSSIKLLETPYAIGAFYFVSADSGRIADVNAALGSLNEGSIDSIEEKYISNDVDFWTPLVISFNKFKADFYLNFIAKDRWKFLVTGLGNTLLLTLLAAVLGIIIGVVIAAIRTTYDNNLETLQHNKGVGYYIMTFLNGVSKLYLTVIRGTPVFVQLLIIFFVIFASSKNKMLNAVLAFGINSGAYVAEILRGGIMSIDKGQFEAGRSIGFNYVRTMYHIIIPQVLKNVLPTLLNEFIALLKETSVACYVGVLDLTRAGNIIRGTTFTDMLPLLAVALIYLAVVLILTKIVSLIERRLKKSER